MKNKKSTDIITWSKEADSMMITETNHSFETQYTEPKVPEKYRLFEESMGNL
jgi:hypothetical protein